MGEEVIPNAYIIHAFHLLTLLDTVPLSKMADYMISEYGEILAGAALGTIKCKKNKDTDLLQRQDKL
jgi:hypothetical protein